MRKFLTLLLCLSALFPSIVEAAESTPNIIDKLLERLDAFSPYRVEMEVIFDGNTISGFYEVDESEYYISIDEQELYGDASTKIEVFKNRKEIVIDFVEKEFNGNILNNPAMAFTSIKEHYTAKVLDSNDSSTVKVELIPKQGYQDKITLSLSSKTMLPTSIAYQFGDDVIVINIISITHITSFITSFDEGKYADYEIIDFR